MAAGMNEARARQALLTVQEAGVELEQARALLVTRAQVALAAGADEHSVAAAANVAAQTMRSWLTGTAPHRKAARR